MILAFSGTRDGMTAAQQRTVLRILLEEKPDIVLHGDCLGADEEFHRIVEQMRGVFGNHPLIEIYPSKSEKMRAHCNGDVIQPPMDSLVRNRKMTQVAQKLIAAPRQSQEVLRSGTWSTIRYARIEKKVIYIVVPNGEVR